MKSTLTCSFCARRQFATVSERLPSNKRTRIAAACMLSRAPLLLPPLTAFEKSYYDYSKRVKRALSDNFEADWFFRRGSQAEKQFLDAQKQLDEPAKVEIEPRPDNANDKNLQSLNRKYDRTLYLLLKKKRAKGEQGQWQFPQGTVEDSDESLLDAALRELQEETGRDMDIFTVSKVPASAFTYPIPPSSSLAKEYDETKDTQVFFMPAKILRGQAILTQMAKKEAIIEFAWLTREEIQERVDKAYCDVALNSGHLLST